MSSVMPARTTGGRWQAGTIGRVIVAFCCVALAMRLSFELLVMPEVLSGAGSGGSRGQGWANEARLLLGALAGLIAACAFGLGTNRRPLLAGAIATVAASISFELVTFGRGRLFAEPQLMLTMLAGWTIGAWVGARAVGTGADDGTADADQRERARDAYGFEGICGALAAAWGLAAVSKLLDGGAGWIGAGTVWHMLFAGKEIALGADCTMETGSWIFDTIAQNPALATTMAATALVVELSAPLLALRGLWRRGVALLLAAMHMGFDVLGGLGHLDLVAVLLVIAALPSAPLPTLFAPRRARPILALALATIVLAWALPIDRWLALPADRRSKAWQIALPQTQPASTSASAPAAAGHR